MQKISFLDLLLWICIVLIFVLVVLALTSDIPNGGDCDDGDAVPVFFLP